MRIAVNARFLLRNGLEGIGEFTCQLLKRLTRTHPEHQFLFFFDRPYDPSFIFATNVTPIILWPPARHPLLWYWWYEHVVAGALDRYGADLFFSPDGFLSLRTNVPTLLAVHDICFEHFTGHLGRLPRLYWRVFTRAAVRNAARVVTASEFSRRDLIDCYGVRGDKIEVIPNGVGDAFSPLPRDEQERVRERYSGGAPYFLHVGAIHPRKNVANLLRAFDSFKRQSGAKTRLLLVGRLAWKFRDVLRVYAGMEHREHVLFLGYRPLEELARLLPAAQALACVSLCEGLGLPLIEAMACGVPVIASDRSALPEVAGGAALLVNPLDPDAIAEAMLRLERDAGLRDDLVRRGTARARDFDWDRSADKLWQALDGLATPGLRMTGAAAAPP